MTNVRIIDERYLYKYVYSFYNEQLYFSFEVLVCLPCFCCCCCVCFGLRNVQRALQLYILFIA